MSKKPREDLTKFYEKFGISADDAAMGIVVTDANGDILSFNKNAQELLGFSLDESKGMNVSELYFDVNDRAQLLNMLALSDTIHDIEIKLKHKDGRPITVLANIDSTQLNGTNVLLTSLYNITQYKQKLDASKEAEKSYRTLFSNAPVGITVTDFHGNLIVNNHAFQNLLGYEAKEIADINAKDFYVIKSDRKRLLDLTESLGHVRDFETILKHKNGFEIDVLINTDKISFRNQPNVLLTSTRDITNLKIIEGELKKERDFSNAVLDVAASLIIVFDNNGMITKFNRACEQISGYTSEEMKGTYLGDVSFISPGVSHGKIDNLLNGQKSMSYDTIWLSKNQDRHLISWTDAALLDGKGQVEYVIATGIDITKRQEAEDKLSSTNKELELWIEQLQERTEELNQLNEMGEKLQLCETVEEACTISSQYVKRICPASHGALYLVDASNNYAEAVEMWGEPAHTRKVFTPISCWAMRSGKQHLIDENHPGLRCEHVDGPNSGQYLCVPLISNGEVMGMLHLNHTDTAQSDPSNMISIACSDHKAQVITTVAEHISLAISNIKLKDILRQESIRDALTGLFNRRYMEETLALELKKAERENKTVGIIMFDIDHFKMLNDLSGHDAGDAVLAGLGEYLINNTRSGEIVCRYGGEEFLVVMPGINNQDCHARAEELRKGIKALSVYHQGKVLSKITVSLGVAVYPQSAAMASTLLKFADEALYRAKEEGRDRVI